MIIVEFPKLNVNNIKIFVAEELSVFVDLGLILNVKQALENVRFLKLSK